MEDAGSKEAVLFSILYPRSSILKSLAVGVGPDLAHGQAVARRHEVDLGHVVPHEQEAATAGAFEILRRGRIGDRPDCNRARQPSALYCSSGAGGNVFAAERSGSANRTAFLDAEEEQGT